MNIPWHDSEYQLKYQLGDYTLARKVFSVRQCEIGIGADEDEIDLPSHRDPDYQGFSVRGLPIDEIGKTLTSNADFYVYNAIQNQRYYLDLSGNFEEYLSRFGGKTRSTLKRKVKKYAQQNPEQTVFKALAGLSCREGHLARYFKTCHRPSARCEAFDLEPEPLEHGDIEIRQRIILGPIEGQVLTVAEAAAGQQDRQVTVVVTSAVHMRT